MQKRSYKFSHSTVDYYFEANFGQLGKIVDQKHAIIITDENVFGHHGTRFKGWNTIVLKAGELYKIQATVDTIIEQLIHFEADRQTTLVGIGGGVITDITGFVASVYMRGIRFGFVPTSVLAMVDASIGGKNGIDVDVYKNMVGLIRQPAFILYDFDFLGTLPQSEWENGFAEIIKHACIRDHAMFRQLEKNSLKTYWDNKKNMSALVQQNAMLKTKLVQKDEFENKERRLLNFGHTLGHALENQYELSHGQAVSIGMTYAAYISEKLTGFDDAGRVVGVLEKYNLPTFAAFNKKKVLGVMKMDKKRVRKEMNYILLEKIGKGVIKKIPVARLEKIIQSL